MMHEILRLHLRMTKGEGITNIVMPNRVKHPIIGLLELPEIRTGFIWLARDIPSIYSYNIFE